MKGIIRREVLKINKHTVSKIHDLVAVEEPLEIKISFDQDDKKQTHDLLVTMRTPGHDRELITGLLFSEGIIMSAIDLDKIVIHGSGDHATAEVFLTSSVNVDVSKMKRNFFSSSSCGVCGKNSVDQLPSSAKITSSFSIDASSLYSLPQQLRSTQSVFDFTGGLHAVGLFDRKGLLFVYEDVGRHNAMDKVVGAAVMKNLLPLSHHIALLSGRASFELLEKAATAGIPIVACVGAPSSLAVKVAEEKGVTLAGFLNEDRFNIYTHPHRIICS
jgi:FdhD protein